MAVEKIGRQKSPGIDQIPAKLIKAGGRTIRSEIHKLIISIWNKDKLPQKWKESIIVPVYKKGDKKQIVIIIGPYHYVRNLIQHPALKVNSTCRENYWG